MRSNMIFPTAALVLVTFASIGSADALVRFEPLGYADVSSSCGVASGLQCARTAEEFSNLWQGSCMPGSRPEVDFRRDMVIAYARRHREGTASVLLRVTAVRRHADKLLVEINSQPGPGATRDYFNVVMVVLHKWPGPVEVTQASQP